MDKGEFIVLIDGEQRTFDSFSNIPPSFENLIKFNPFVIPPPHTEEQHEQNALWMDKFKDLISRETK